MGAAGPVDHASAPAGRVLFQGTGRARYPVWGIADPGTSSSRSFGSYLIAGAVLIVAAWILLKVVIGLVTAVASVVVLVLAVIAVIWAVRVLF